MHANAVNDPRRPVSSVVLPDSCRRLRADSSMLSGGGVACERRATSRQLPIALCRCSSVPRKACKLLRNIELPGLGLQRVGLLFAQLMGVDARCLPHSLKVPRCQRLQLKGAGCLASLHAGVNASNWHVAAKPTPRGHYASRQRAVLSASSGPCMCMPDRGNRPALSCSCDVLANTSTCQMMMRVPYRIACVDIHNRHSHDRAPCVNARVQ